MEGVIVVSSHVNWGSRNRFRKRLFLEQLEPRLVLTGLTPHSFAFDLIDLYDMRRAQEFQEVDGDGIGSECDGMELSIGGNGTIEADGDSIPSIGMVGTVVAISAGFFLAIRREDEE